MIDEFQDTTPAQYRLVRFLAGEEFKNIFVVADDDQIIYEWAGASYRQIAEFREHFEPDLIQLVENRRCPPEVVRAANNLIARNSERTPGKAPLVATRPSDGLAVVCQRFKTDVEEATAVAAGVLALGPDGWGHVGILSRTRAVLRPVLQALQEAGVRASLIARRGRFVSPQFLWLESCLDLSLRPTDDRMFTAMGVSANRIASMDVGRGHARSGGTVGKRKLFGVLGNSREGYRQYSCGTPSGVCAATGAVENCLGSRGRRSDSMVAGDSGRQRGAGQRRGRKTGRPGTQSRER